MSTSRSVQLLLKRALFLGLVLGFNLLGASAFGDDVRQMSITAVSPTYHMLNEYDRYIIQFRPEPSGQFANLQHLSLTDSQVNSYQQQLLLTQAQFISALSQEINRPVSPLFQYSVAFNGVALELAAAEVTAVINHPDVWQVFPEKVFELTTDRGPQWIEAPAVWDGSQTPGNVATKGEGIIIGVLDTGINYEHISFADVGADGYDHTNPWGVNVYVGACQETPSICNDKLIGAWDFVDELGEFDGVSDSNGHGSHTASTAAGNVVMANMIANTGYEYETEISGVAPHANIVAYDVCTVGCFQTALLAAVDQAIADGVDVINYSISGGVNPYSDPVSQAFLVANQAGIVVSASAGNNGPASSSINHVEPWVISVAAGTHDRHFQNRLTQFTGGNSTLEALNGSGFTQAYGPAKVVLAADFGDAQCLNAFTPGTWNGEIVVCDRGIIGRVQKGENVVVGGAGGMVLANTAVEGSDLSNDDHFLPTVHLTATDAARLKSWLASGTNHQARISGAEPVVSDGDRIAGFSSRGPTLPYDLIKPDLLAPGVGILAAYFDGEEDFAFLDGTSMAAPHVAGAAALLRSLYPSWTADEIRSALMMTSVPVTNEVGSAFATPYGSGAGRIDVAKASQAGLLINETDANYNDVDPLDKSEFANLNIPSLTHGHCFESCQWTRTVRNPLTTAVEWTATAVSPDGLIIDITPSVFTVNAGMTQTLTISADVTQFFAPSGWGFGIVYLSSPGQETLHLPMAVQEATSSDESALHMQGLTYAEPGQRITYEIELNNLDPLTRTMVLTNTLPANVSFVAGSASSGLAYDDPTHQITWQGDIGPGELGYEGQWVAPLEYFNFGQLSNPPANLCSNFADCDEVTAVFDLTTLGHSFPFFGESITSLNVVSNGYLMGADGLSSIACTACPQPFPNIAEPNQLIAGLWRDLDMSNGNGQFYAGFLNGLLENPDDIVFYANWQDAGQFGAPFSLSAHAIAIVLDGQSEPAGRIYFLYSYILDHDQVTEDGYVIGVENKDGTTGTTVGFAPCHLTPCALLSPIGSLPLNNSTYRLDPAIVAGDNGLRFTYDVIVTGDVGELLTNRVEVTNLTDAEVITAVSDTLVDYRTYYPFVGKSP